MQRVNVHRVETHADEADPVGYRAAAVKVGRELGSEELSLNVFDIPPGENLCPYHYEYVEEWLLVLDGTPSLRGPGGEEELEAGDLVRFPAGPDGAHKLMNQAGAPARVIMFSSSREPSVAVYPDSGKVGVWTPNPEDRWMLRGSDGKVGYYEGEAGEPERGY
jgi:uncharacterized cupin superfamily protein